MSTAKSIICFFFEHNLPKPNCNIEKTMNITAQNEIQPSVSATGENTSTALNSTLSLTDDIWMYPYILRLSTTLFFSLIIFFGLLGNSFVMATLIRWPDMRTAFNLLIANICLADLAVCSVAAPLRIIEIFRGWIFGEFAFWSRVEGRG